MGNESGNFPNKVNSVCINIKFYNWGEEHIIENKNQNSSNVNTQLEVIYIQGKIDFWYCERQRKIT